MQLCTYGNFRDLESLLLFFLDAFLSLSFYALIRANGREHRLVHINEDLIE
jgi:hypothetical protein